MIGSKRLVIHQCPPTTQDILITLWNYGEPSNTAWVTVKNCKNVEIDMSCTVYRKSFEMLTIENVTNLHFTRSITTKKNPPKIVLKDIKNIPVIPENTFTIPLMMKYTGPAEEHELQEINFDSVNIGIIESHAFHSLRGFKNFTWNNVTVKDLRPKAITINFNTTEQYQGRFLMKNSSMMTMEYLSFQLDTKQAVFRNNTFVEIMPGGISGTIETFNFTNNVIDILQPGSISILAKTVNILGNTFNYLKSGSLEKISPGLLVDSHTNFGNLEFRYTFNNNNIVYMDAGSLNPDIVAYKKVSTNLTFNFNNFLCTCDNLGWLISSNNHGSSTASLKTFYETVTDETASNMCSGLTCKLTIAYLKHFFRNGKCIYNSPMEDFCKFSSRTLTVLEVDSRLGSDRWYNKSMFLNTNNNVTMNLFLKKYTL
ncbi:hypothetical protein HHI36_018681 [Cryptolaemus montrouzieri]|uniref:Uncharacterized protein n=1 Tax=Cryptolaemus montrouzieri TaxID=559131 RepID=A0ABD2P0R0_9CUCU